MKTVHLSNGFPIDEPMRLYVYMPPAACGWPMNVFVRGLWLYAACGWPMFVRRLCLAYVAARATSANANANANANASPPGQRPRVRAAGTYYMDMGNRAATCACLYAGVAAYVCMCARIFYAQYASN